MQNRFSNGNQRAPLEASGEMGFEFSFAFQPIVNADTREIISFEALVRGPHGEPSGWVFAQVPRARFARFDEMCRQKAIHLASRLKIDNRLNLNISPEALFHTDMTITATFKASIDSGIPVGNIIFEVLEHENMTDRRNLLQYLRIIQDFGFKTAFDDFGAGYSGLKLLVEYQPTFIKLDRQLIGNIHLNPVMQSIVRGIQDICKQLSVEIVAEGVEKAGEYHWLRDLGIKNFQGFFFAKPVFEALPDVANRVFSF
jgi:EAL domain-containing protein (putative c-di-GMP-specific phosphodiesterase class I)